MLLRLRLVQHLRLAAGLLRRVAKHALKLRDRAVQSSASSCLHHVLLYVRFSPGVRRNGLLALLNFLLEELHTVLRLLLDDHVLPLVVERLRLLLDHLGWRIAVAFLKLRRSHVNGVLLGRSLIYSQTLLLLMERHGDRLAVRQGRPETADLVLADFSLGARQGQS
jgi:hypothetical protein